MGERLYGSGVPVNLRTFVYDSLLSMGLFVAQGGLAGGHGKFDWLILTLMLPAVLLVEVVPLPAWVLHYDFMYTIALATVLNTVLIMLLGRLLSWIRTRRISATPRNARPGT